MRSVSLLPLAALALMFASALRAADAGNPLEPGYGVNAGDVLSVFVWNEESLARDLLVGPDGSVSFPMVGNLPVKGLTTDQIGERIAAGLGEFLRDEPLVTVSLIGVDGNKIYVHGEVTNPGAYVLNSQIDIMQALALAGGMQTFAKEADVKVVRRSPDGTQRLYPFNYARFKNGENLDSNILLQAGDVVVVP
jgi:polysaccharide export outer membrane protein